MLFFHVSRVLSQRHASFSCPAALHGRMPRAQLSRARASKGAAASCQPAACAQLARTHTPPLDTRTRAPPRQQHAMLACAAPAHYQPQVQPSLLARHAACPPCAAAAQCTRRTADMGHTHTRIGTRLVSQASTPRGPCNTPASTTPAAEASEGCVWCVASTCAARSHGAPPHTHTHTHTRTRIHTHDTTPRHATPRHATEQPRTCACNNVHTHTHPQACA
jgi:hypothetical protein